MDEQTMNRGLGYGCYILTSWQFLQFALFTSSVGGFSKLFPYHVDANNDWWDWPSADKSSWQYAHPFLNNMFWLGMFGFTHSLTARLWFRDTIKSYTSHWFERMGYMACSAFSFYFLVKNWMPLTEMLLWDFSGNSIGSMLNGLYIAGLVWVAVSLFYIGLYDEFDYRKAFGEIVETASFPDYLPPVYRATRQPLFGGLLFCFWMTSRMTFGHFLFAAAMTIYTTIGVRFQEKDKLKTIGAKYAEYQRRVPLFFPSLSALLDTSPTVIQHSEALERKERPPIPLSPIDVHTYQKIGKR
jgi:protein-S-isoprenylcysteine O-methyltransferase Ste14